MLSRDIRHSLDWYEINSPGVFETAVQALVTQSRYRYWCIA